MTNTKTKQEFQASAEGFIQKYMDILGLSGAWHWHFQFATDAHEALRSGSCAAATYNIALKEVRIIFHELTKPEHYEELAAHETLHILFASLLHAINQLPEPARSVLEADLHASVSRLAFALSGTPYYFMDGQRLSTPPWETE